MPKDKSGKEIACHIVDLQPSDPEYQEVLKASKKVKMRHYTPLRGRIISIQRIQNPNLYVQYARRKETINKQNPNIRTERWLFCDCEENNVDNICHQGFNKSIASRSCKCHITNIPNRHEFFSFTATMFGGGVSFSVEVPSRLCSDAQFVFYTRVLTGDYTEGHGKEELVAPPPKDPSSNMTVLYDSVVNHLKSPGQSVVFSNDQSYPDYLIKYASLIVKFGST